MEDLPLDKSVINLKPESWLVTAGRSEELGAPLNVPLIPASNFIIGGGREPSRRVPQFITLPSSYAGAWYLPQVDQRRTAALADAYANWLSRAL